MSLNEMTTEYQTTRLQKIDKVAQTITVLYPITTVGSIIRDGGDETLEELLNSKAPLESPVFTGTPTAPTPNTSDVTQRIATTAFVKALVDAEIAALDALRFKGTLGEGGMVTELPADHEVGDTYKVCSAGVYAGYQCEIGDLVICITDGTVASDADWTVVQNNVDGAVIGPSESINLHLAVFDGTSGKVIADSGFTIATSVPENAVFTDTTYQAVTTLTNGLMTATDKIKLDTIATGAQVNIIEEIAINNVTQIPAGKTISFTVPTQTSNLVNNSGFITNTVNNLTNYYLKTETYTQSEINALLVALNTVTIEKVDELPITGTPNVIYLVPETDPYTTDAYDEYIWCVIDSTTVPVTYGYEKIGETDIDLSDYVSVNSQVFTTEEKAQARTNIGAVSQEVIVSNTEPAGNIPLWINPEGDGASGVMVYRNIISNAAATTPTITLEDNKEYRFSTDLTSLTLNSSLNSMDGTSKIIFKAASAGCIFNATTSGTTFCFLGDDCTNYTTFTPINDKRYEILIDYNGIYLICRVTKFS